MGGILEHSPGIIQSHADVAAVDEQLGALRDYLPDEAEAVSVAAYGGSLPLLGLLQTADYADAHLRTTYPDITTAERDEIIAVRLARQVLLERKEVPLRMFIEPSVLGSTAQNHLGQTQHLLDIMQDSPRVPTRDARVSLHLADELHSSSTQMLRGSNVLRVDRKDGSQTIHVEEKATNPRVLRPGDPEFDKLNKALDAVVWAGWVSLKNTVYPEWGVLHFTHAEMEALILGMKAGEFDDLGLPDQADKPSES